MSLRTRSAVSTANMLSTSLRARSLNLCNYRREREGLMTQNGSAFRTSLTLTSTMICSLSSLRPSNGFSTSLMPDFSIFAQQLGISFHNLGLLTEALTHRPYLNEHREDTSSAN